MIRILTFIIMFLIAGLAISQDQIKIGQWKSFLPFDGGVSVTQSDNNIIYGTDDGLVTISKEDESITFITKEDGLTEIATKLVKYHSDPATLIVVYQNSNIDLITEDDIKNLNNIAQNNIIIGNKTINHIYTNDKFAYFSAGFGLVQLDLQTQKFGFTLNTPTPVNASAIFDGKQYIATDDGLFYYNLSDNSIISDFNNWRLVGEQDGLPENHSAQEVAVYKEKLYAGINGELYKEDNGWLYFHSKEDFKVDYISPEGTMMMVGYTCNSGCIDRTLFYDENAFRHEAGFLCNDRPTYSIEGDSGKIYYADNNSNFRIGGNEFATCDLVRYNTPFNSDASDLALSSDGTLFVASGGVSGNFDARSNKSGFFIYDNGIWTSRTFFNDSQIMNLNLNDFWQVEPLPDKSKVYFSSFGFGLVEYDFENYTVYNQTNSIIAGAAGDIGREKIGGLAIDDDLNVWFTNYTASDGRSLLVKTNTDEIFSFNPKCESSTALYELVIDQRGYKWMLNASSSGGLVVYDDNGTIDYVDDDRCKSFSANNSELLTNRVLSIAVDLDGDIWVGTEEGPVIFDGSADIFDGDHAGFVIKIDQDGIIALLLSEEEILSIGIDGANRKWLGTRNGIFVQSADGKDQIQYLNTSNSPLLDNQVNDIVINQENGIVWLATNVGITSVRTDATVGSVVHNKDEVYVFPNPIREDYTGPIAIKGLARDANVKITDIQGKLVYETTANGGQAIWDGNNFEGRRSATGVYLVYSTSVVNGFVKPDAFVTKLLFVK